jgi:ATP-binding cassette subfamily F protein 3
MISISGLNLHLGGRTLFNNISFFVGVGEKVALAGINGSGKTTLLNIIAESSDKAINLEPGKVLGYLPQHLHFTSTQTALAEVVSAVGDIAQLQSDVDRIGIELTERTDYESDDYMRLTEEISSKAERLSLLEPDKIEGKAMKLLKGLGFNDGDVHKLYEEYSGGWKMRIELAKILIQEPDIILLDEPTNHLDIQSIIWFENYLESFEGTAIIISHDQRFLDNVTNRTVEIIQGIIHDFPMNYTKYLIERALRVEHMERTAKNQEKEQKRTQELIDKFRAKASKASMAKSLQKKLDRMDDIDMPNFNQKEAAINFSFSRNSGKEVMRTEGICKSFGNKAVLNDVNLTISRGDKVALVGKNGIGKSTILKILKGILPKDKGEIFFGHEVHTAFFMQDEGDKLDGNQTILGAVESVASSDTYLMARAICGAFLFSGEDVEKKIKVLSGGERNRVALAQIAINPYNTLVLDEPTNHLDIPTKERLKMALKNFPGTVVVVSHDRAFLSGLCSTILEIQNGETKEFLGDIDEFIDKERFNWLGVEKKAAAAKPKKEAKPAEKPKYEDSKEQRNKVKRQERIEKDIEKYEQEKVELELKMSENKDDVQSLLSDYEKLQTTIDTLYKEWETL